MKDLRLYTPFDKWKSYGLWAEVDGVITPLIYLKKSKYISEEIYHKICSQLELGLKESLIKELEEEE